MNQEHDVFFKVFHHVLKMGEYFSSWNRLHFCLDCSFCPGQLETLDHLFLNCPFARGSGLGPPPFSARCSVLQISFLPLRHYWAWTLWRVSHSDPETGSLFSQADPVCYLASQEDEAF